MFKPEDILNRLEDAMPEMTVSEPMPGDRWLVSSAMQKAIRRGETERALRAAVSLYQHDRQNFWRRLHVAAMEDCSADVDIVVTVLTATVSSAWRRRMGDLRVGLFLTRMLCESVKSRAVDELYLQLERAGRHQALRERFAQADDARLLDCVTEDENALPKRALALWYLAGTKKFPTDIMPQRVGNPEYAKMALRSLNVPSGLVESCIAVMSRTQWPLSIFTPLVWQENFKQDSPPQVAQHHLPVVTDIAGVPLYGSDMYTRIGQTCYRILRKAVPALMPFSVKQIGLAMFYAEGALLDRAITSPLLGKLRRDAESADMENIGLLPSEYARLQECLAENADTLAVIRQEQLTQYLSCLTQQCTGEQV